MVNTDINFELRVSDGTNEVTDDVTVTVRADDDAPTASAGDSYQIEEGQFAHLSGVGLDPEGQGLSYEWIQVSGPEVQLDDPSAAEASFLTPNEVRNTDIVFELHVSDGVNTSVDTITITVEADDDAPSADAGADDVFPAGSPVTLGGSGTDPEGEGLTYSWVQTEGPSVVLFNAESPTPSFNAPGGLGGTIVFELHVSDGVNTSIDTVSIRVTEEPDFDAPGSSQGGGDSDPADDSKGDGTDDREDEGPNQELADALLTVHDDVEEGPLKEVLGEVLHLADAEDAPDVRADLLDLLEHVVERQDFHQVFNTDPQEGHPIDEAPSLLGKDMDGTAPERNPVENLAVEGHGEDGMDEQSKPQSAVAKFFGLIRGLAGTSDKSESSSTDRKTKDTQRRD